MPAHTLPPVTPYRPFSDGRYTVTARLRALGDLPHFQVCARYLEYLQAKEHNRLTHPGRYDVRDGLAPELERACVDFALAKLPKDQPEAFAVAIDGDRARFENRMLGLVMAIDLPSCRVVDAPRRPAGIFADGLVGLSAFSALALQTQEDWALIARDPATNADKTVAMAVSFPSHWRPAEKVGMSFMETHRPVAGIDPLLAAAPSLVETMIHRGPWERFTWTLPRTPHLDEHLDVLALQPPPVVPARDAVGESCWLRVERQTVQGFPAAHGALFTIRLHIEPLSAVAANPVDARALAAAVRTMTPASLAYKSLDDWHETLLAYLDAAGQDTMTP